MLRCIYLAIWLAAAVYVFWFVFDSFILGNRTPSLFEAPEKEVLAACLACAVMLKSSLFMGGKDRRISVWTFVEHSSAAIALLFGLVTAVTKGYVTFYSEDSDIAGWHHLCAWAGISLVLYALITYQQRSQSSVTN